MAWEALTVGEVAVDAVIDTTLMTKIKDDLDYLYGQGSLLRGSVPNGNFEIDADEDGVPDGWTRSLYAGGVGEFDETTPMEGMRSWKFTHPGGNGNGGGYLTGEYLECSEYESYGLYALHYTSVTGIKDKIQIQYYDEDKVVNGSAVDLYNSSACEIAPEFLTLKFTPTAGSKFLKIILTGGHTDGIIAGSSYFDDISMIKMITGSVLPDTTAITCTALVIDYPTEVITTDTSYVTLHEWKINRAGTYTISFQLTAHIGASPDYPVYGRIYKNGIAFGTQRSVHGHMTTESEIFSQDLVFAAGDYIQFKGYRVTPTESAGISLIKFYANDHTYASRIS